MSERTWFHTLPTGLRLEVISAEVPSSSKPPLLFIHGVAHGAWCWQETFLPYFKSKGYDCHAISLRAQAGSERPQGAKAGGTVMQHVEDISHFIQIVLKRAPVLVGHSYGGLLVQSYLCRGYETRERVAGVVLLASGPPQGNEAMIKRRFFRSPLTVIWLVWSLVWETYRKYASSARGLFFSAELSEAQLERYFGLLRDNHSPVPLIDEEVKEPDWPLPPPPPAAPPVFVVGGDADQLVDAQAVRDTARHYGVTPVVLRGAAHDIMLDTRWEEAAEVLEGWCARVPTD